MKCELRHLFTSLLFNIHTITLYDAPSARTSHQRTLKPSQTPSRACCALCCRIMEKEECP